jgi:hypothetical protein
MRSCRFIQMVEGLSRRIAPSGSLDGGATSAHVVRHFRHLGRPEEQPHGPDDA